MKQKDFEITHPPLISSWRESTGFLRATAGAVVLFFLWLNVHPALAAVKDEIKHPSLGKAAAQVSARPEDPHVSVEAKLREVLTGLNQSVKPAHDLVIKRVYKNKKGQNITDITIIGTPEAPAVQKQQRALEEIALNLKEVDQQTLRAFHADAEHLGSHHLPQIIMDRHDAAVRKFKAQAKDVQDKIRDIESGTNAVALYDGTQALLSQLQSYEPKPAPFDPKHLPFDVEKPLARKAALTSNELKSFLNPNLKHTRAALDATPIQARKGEASAQQIAHVNDQSTLAEYSAISGKIESAEVASTGTMTAIFAASALTPPGPEYLAPTVDVQLTQTIQDLATQLHHNPVEIYNWVYTSIDWIPTYGSVQGSQLTLEKKAGNAFDISSLLIALLRASNIPARFVYGTVQVPADKLMNWAGGFTVADAAQTFISTGGIPNNALTSGGKTVAFQIEHVWVEAFVDFYPSRGATNVTPDSWAPMDAAFKQYNYTQGMDLQQSVPFDAQSFVNAAQQGATIDSTNGFVQNLNQTNIQNQLTQYQQQLQNFINIQKPNATVGDVLGAKAIQPTAGTVLAASLPYKLIARGNSYSSLPDSLRHKFQYSLYEDAYQRDLGNPILTYTESTPNLAGKKVTLAFVPASDSDRQAIESYLPKPHADGSPIQPSEFPSSLPAYNIHVTAELRVEGQVVASGGNYTLGSQLLGEGGFTRLYNLNDWDLTTDAHIAGQLSAIGISMQGISAGQMVKLRTRLSETRAAISGSAGALSGERFSGDVLTAIVWSYFAAVEEFGHVFQSRLAMVDLPGLSYGFLHVPIEPRFSYGLVVRADFPGMLMDVGHLRRIVFSKNNDLNAWVNYNRERGKHASVMEHAVPASFFADEGHPSEGVSAMKAIQVAMQQGQKVYTITQTNQAQLSNIQQSDSVKNNIRDAVAAGKEVTIHERPISYAGFVGAGYLVIDPKTGGGSYLVEGGAHGAIFVLLLIAAIPLLYFFFAYAAWAALIFYTGLMEAPLAAILILIDAYLTQKDVKTVMACDYLSGFLAIMASIVLGGMLAAFVEEAALSIQAEKALGIGTGILAPDPC